MSTFHIVSLDGGGIRGVLTAALLERIEMGSPGFLTQVDLFAGTSTGGILSLALASGMTPGEARNLYERLGARVFKDSFWDNLEDLGQLRGAQYSNSTLKEELVNQFGSMTLADLPFKVIVSSFDLDNEASGLGKVRSWKPKYFHNFPGSDSDGHEKVVDVALYTSAAPTFFPVYHGYVDGGVVSNNPSMCAVAQALEPNTGKQLLRNIRLLSLGTGFNPKFMTANDEDWGLLQWAPHLISLILEGSSGLVDYQCRQLLANKYLRINPILPLEIGLDGVDQIPLMKSLASQFDLGDSIPWVKRNFKKQAVAKKLE
jgi:patatin-like phospholipase/acyl hydrolase